jgi:hypothetical protein
MPPERGAAGGAGFETGETGFETGAAGGLVDGAGRAAPSNEAGAFLMGGGGGAERT